MAPVGRDGAAYYFAERDLAATLEGPLRPSSSAGKWLGGGAHGLGLVGTCEPAQLAAVLEGRRPGGGALLVNSRQRVPGFDLVFTAPKSVSVLHGLGDADLRRAVLQCHLDAVDGAMRYLGAHAVVARRRSAGLGATVLTGGPVAARFTHGTSRAGDPHLHSHVVVANLAHGSDGRWSTTDSRALYAHRNAAGALYDAHLRDSLRRGLGVSWERVGAGRYDIVGIPRAVRGEFSSRSAEIRSELATVGRPSRSRRTAAWASTREPLIAEASSG